MNLNAFFIFAALVFNTLTTHAVADQDVASKFPAPTVSHQQALESDIASAVPLTFDEVRAYFTAHPDVALECSDEVTDSSADSQNVLRGLYPQNPSFELKFTVQPVGDGFNILVAKANEEFRPEQNLSCAADAKYNCSSLKFTTKKSVQVDIPDYAPDADVTEGFEFFPTVDGNIWARYDYSINISKIGFLGQRLYGDAQSVSALCKKVSLPASPATVPQP